MARMGGNREAGKAAAGPGPAGWRPNWAGFSWRLGLIAAALMAVIVLAARHFGAAGLFAGMGALQAVLASAAAPLHLRPRAAVWFAAVGVGATVLAGAAAGNPAAATLALAVVAFLGACGLAVGPVAARLTNVMALWFVTAIALHPAGEGYARPALGFLAGSLAVFAALEALRLAKGVQLEPAPPFWPRVREGLAWGSPVLSFAIVYALSGAVALALGARMTPEHWAWPAAAALVLVRPTARESLSMSASRLAGTAIGAQAAVAVIGRVEDPRLLLALGLGASFMLAATLKVDYAIFALFLTAQVVAFAALTGRDPLQAGLDRIEGTLIGALVAVAAMIVLRRMPGYAPAPLPPAAARPEAGPPGPPGPPGAP